MIRIIRWLLLVGLFWVGLASIPSLARYLKMRSM
jgi:hypothetical protein